MTDAAKKVKSMFSRLGAPPSPAEALQNLQLPATQKKEPTEPLVQVNVRVPATVKKKLRLMAARDNKGISDVILDAIALYEERYGQAPNL